MELFCLVCSLCFGCYENIFPASYFRQTRKAQSRFLRISGFTADNFAADDFGIVHILKHGAVKGDTVRMQIRGLCGVAAAGKCLAKNFILQSISQKNGNILYGGIMVRIV